MIEGMTSAASGMKSAQIASSYSVKVLKNSNDFQEEIATTLINELANLDIGSSTPSKLDVSV